MFGLFLLGLLFGWFVFSLVCVLLVSSRVWFVFLWFVVCWCVLMMVCVCLFLVVNRFVVCWLACVLVGLYGCWFVIFGLCYFWF